MPNQALDLAAAFRLALQPVVESLNEVKKNTQTTADATKARFGGSGGAKNMAPASIFGTGLSQNRFAGPMLASAGRQMFGVRGARGLGFRLPMFLPGAAGVAGASAGAMGAGAVKAMMKPVKRFVVQTISTFAELGLEFGYSRETFKAAYWTAAENIPFSGKVIRRGTSPIRRAHQRLLAITGPIARGRGKVTPELRQKLEDLLETEEVLAEREARQVEKMQVKSLANNAKLYRELVENEAKSTQQVRRQLPYSGR